MIACLKNETKMKTSLWHIDTSQFYSSCTKKVNKTLFFEGITFSIVSYKKYFLYQKVLNLEL